MCQKLSSLALLAAIVLALLACAESQACKPVTKANATMEEAKLLSSFHYLLRCEGISVSRLQYLWSILLTTADCGVAPFEVFLASTTEELKLRQLNGSGILCQRECAVEQSPFFPSRYIGVQARFPLGTRRGAAMCKFQTEHATQKHFMGPSFVLGAVLVLFAAAWSTSLALRIIAAALVSASFSIFLAVYLVCRFVTGNRGIASMSSLLSGIFVLRVVTIWFPTVESAICSPCVWAYIVAWAGVGAATMYISGAGMNNPRIGYVLQVAFQTLGLALVYAGSWTHTPFFAVLVTLSVMFWTKPPSFWYPCNWVRWSQPEQYCYEEESATKREQIKEGGRSGQKPPLRPQPQPRPLKMHEFSKIGFYMGPNGLVQLGSPEFDALCKKGYQANTHTAQIEKGSNMLSLSFGLGAPCESLR